MRSSTPEDQCEVQLAAVEACLLGKGYSVDQVTTKATPWLPDRLVFFFVPFLARRVALPWLTVSWARGGVTQASILVQQFATEAIARANARAGKILSRQVANFVIDQPEDDSVATAVAGCVHSSPKPPNGSGA